MKSEEFRNIKNGYFIYLVAKLWLEPHDPEQLCRKNFERIFSELKKDAASGVIRGNFTLASIESDEEYNDKSITENISRAYPGLYSMVFRFLYIFEGDGIMDDDDVYIPKIEIPGTVYSSSILFPHECLNHYKWLNEYWYSSVLPAEFLISRTTDWKKYKSSAASAVPEHLGEFSKRDEEGRLFDRSSNEWHRTDEWHSTNQTAYDVFYCSPWDNENQRLYIKVYSFEYRVPPVVMFQASETCDNKTYKRFSCDCSAYFHHGLANIQNMCASPVEIIRTNSAFDALPLGEKMKMIVHALSEYLDERDMIDNW